MKATILFLGLGLVNNPKAQITIEQKGKADVVYNVDQVLICDDTGVLEAIGEGLGIKPESMLS